MSDLSCLTMLQCSGMNVAAGPRLAAAVTNAGACGYSQSLIRSDSSLMVIFCSQGGIGVIGGVRQSPKMLQDNIDELKSHLEDKNAPFGVDLLIPQVGGNARKTNVSFGYVVLPCRIW